MVMRKSAMRKNLRQSILNSLGRYVAIVAIIALGASMFVGLLMTKTDMVTTGQKFMDEQNMFDLRMMSSYGWNTEQVEEIAQMEGVVDAEGIAYLDVIATVEDQDEAVYRFYTIPEIVNRVSLRGGRMPEKDDECLAEGFHATKDILGKKVTIADTNSEDTREAMTYKTYTIVGYVATPLYMDMNHGTTSVGNGSLSSYFYIPQGAMELDYYPEIHVTIPGDYAVYTKAYNAAMESAAERMKPLLEPLAYSRLEQVRNDATQLYYEGLQEYYEGVKEFHDGKAEAEKELEEGLVKLQDAEQEIADNEQLLKDGEKQLADGEKMLKESEITLQQSKKTLADAKASAYKQISNTTTSLLKEFDSLSAGLTPLEGDLTGIQSESIALGTTILQLETELTLIDSQISQTNSMIRILNTSIQTSTKALELAKQNGADDETLARMEQELQELEDTRSGYETKLAQKQKERSEKEAELAPYYAQQEVLEAKKEAISQQILQLKDTIASITEELVTLAAMQAVMDAEFATADAQIQSGEAQIQAAYLELDLRKQEMADGWIALDEGKKELEDAWQTYYEGKAEADAELADAEAKLLDAKLELDDARDTISSMTETSVYVLDRTSNIGYNSLESSSDIVQGVSRVFPAFFLAVAALVCITTMTRMIDEERVQIGTLKSLGYSNLAIISKYLIYAGSGAVVGCGLGVLLGSVVFPAILWQAYKIMLYITDGIVLKINWWLCGIVVLAYTAVMLLVTWYCCRRALEEEPAELVRPKAPEAGKKILLEYLPFWNKLSFLNKVMIRNIFRYRQRLAMMMLGIGGCTALLVTGFGLRDSIVNVVDYQFEEVTTYDMSVYFSEGRSEEQKREFCAEISDQAEHILFYHQSSMDMRFDGRTKELYLIAAGENITQFIDFHHGKHQLNLPETQEVLLSSGVAEAMGIDVGDTVTMQDADLRSLELTVSGIYDNHVENYAIVRPDAIKGQWGDLPEEQMAFVTVREGEDPHALSAVITGLDDVMNVSVSEDLAEMVGGMMDALNLVVWVVVVCAGALAAIVLYNLTNINITERIREIATIKVLGFNAKETAAYVFKENMALSVAGSVFGLGLGYLLLLFVMSQVKIDMVWFKALVYPKSYIASIVLTILAACIVDFIFYFKLEKINMAEALKSVE